MSGFVPARRATRIEPVEAMREAATPGTGRGCASAGSSSPRRVELVGLAILLYALFGDPGNASATASLLGFGAVLMMFGFALLAPTLVRPLQRPIGRRSSASRASPAVSPARTPAASRSAPRSPPRR